MPIYEYRCSSCSETFEVFAKFSDPEPTQCEHCGAETIEKVLHPAAVHYKGSGFYATDYAQKGSSRPGAGSDGGGSEPTGDSGSKDGGSGTKESTGGSASGESGSSGSAGDSGGSSGTKSE